MSAAGNIVYLPIGWPLAEEAPPRIDDGVEIPIERQIAELEAELASHPAAVRVIARGERIIDQAEAVVRLIRAGAEIMLREGD